MGQDKIKFERVLQEDWLNVPDKTLHNNSIVIITDDNLIYTLGTHIGASKGNELNNTIFFKDVNATLPEYSGVNYVLTTPQYLTGKQLAQARYNIGAAPDSNNINTHIYNIVDEIKNDNDILYSDLSTTEIELYENIIKFNINCEITDVLSLIYKYIIGANKNEVSVIIANNTENNISYAFSKSCIIDIDNLYIINNKSNDQISVSIQANSSIELNFLFIDNECRLIILQ